VRWRVRVRVSGQRVRPEDRVWGLWGADLGVRVRVSVDSRVGVRVRAQAGPLAGP
jgi:hypothetical protein